VVDAQRVLEPGVIRARVHEVRRRELADVPQPLERPGVDDALDERVRELDVAVDGIFDLGGGH